MHLLHLLCDFVGGAILMNAVPHLVSGAMGRRFPSPFAKPAGAGQSSALVNMLWGFGNLVIAYLLICQVGAFDLGNLSEVGALGLGAILLGLGLARHFGALNGGRGPDLA